jgi:penicillin-binding protein-related factor A (putative recombinase)
MRRSLNIPGERKIQAAVLRYLRNLAPLGKFFKIMSANERGVPDIIGIYKGQFFAFEIKRPGEQLKPIQRRQAYEITAADGRVYRID